MSQPEFALFFDRDGLCGLRVSADPAASREASGFLFRLSDALSDFDSAIRATREIRSDPAAAQSQKL